MKTERIHEDGPLWDFARSRMGRRRFLALLAAGGASAVLAACGVSEMPEATSDPHPGPPPQGGGDSGAAPSRTISKDPASFLVHDDKSWEARLENMQGLLTPNSLFFVRNNSVSLDLDPAAWRLSVEGDAIDRPMELTYADITGLPATGADVLPRMRGQPPGHVRPGTGARRLRHPVEDRRGQQRRVGRRGHARCAEPGRHQGQRGERAACGT